MALWTPAEIDTALWLQCDDQDSNLFSTGGNQLLDKSGNNRHFVQTTEAKKPQYVEDILNGTSGLRFNGTSHELQSDVSMPSDAVTWFIAHKLNSLPGTSAFFCIACLRANASNRTELLAVNIAGYQPTQIINDLGSGMTTAVGTSRALDTSPRVFGWTYNDVSNSSAASYTATHNGAAQSVVASGDINITDAALSKIGNRIAQNQWAPIDLYEIIAITGVASADIVGKITGYICWRLGLQDDLPSDHPYKSAAPTSSTLSGVVTVNSSPAQRTVLVYKNDDADLFMSTQSDATTGEWQVIVDGEETDRYRVVMVGESGEYSKVFEDVTAG